MAHIDIVAPGDATGPLQRLYDALTSDGSPIDEIVMVHSVNPPALRHHLQLYEHAMRGPSPLSTAQREMIAVTVSAANRCFY